jgi:hypothetical protein
MGKDATPKNGSTDDSVKAIRAELAAEQKIEPPPDNQQGSGGS